MISLLRRLCGFEMNNAPIGVRGERHAAQWLAARGYRVIQRNVSLGDDEIDILAIDPDGCTLVIVEVKTRTQAQPPPEASVGQTKQYRLARCAARLQRQRKFRDSPIRFDVIAIVWPDGEDAAVTHWAGAFQSPF